MDDASAPSPWQTLRFEVQMQLEPLDYLQMMRALRWSAVERGVAWLAVTGMAGIGAIAALLLLEPFSTRLPALPYIDWRIVIALAGGLAAFAVFNVFVMGPYIDGMFYGQPIGMGETSIVADTTAVTNTSAGVVTRVPWDKVQDVVVGKNHLFLMFGRVTGLIIPRRAFADAGDAQRFAEFVHSMTRKPA
jgi:YcxB-like protein